jgi:hypothetical protein
MLHYPRFGLLTYRGNPQYNVGDYIQSIAARQYLPRVDEYISRERLAQYKGPAIQMILNGWFTHDPKGWPPSTAIEPLVISFHINSQVQARLLNEDGLQWFSKHEPIGCRDPYTLKIFENVGIDAYYSGCLTSSLRNKWNYRTEQIYLVDPLFRVPDISNVLRPGNSRQFARALISGHLFKGSRRTAILGKLFAPDLLQAAQRLTHFHTGRHTQVERFAMAECLLEKYATARLVITSRLHCALPCLAFGTPVIFLNAGFTDEQDRCRLDGMLDLFNVITIGENDVVQANFHWNGLKIDKLFQLPNPGTYRQWLPNLAKRCNEFLSHASAI